MPLHTTRWKLIALLGVILVAGFLGINLLNYSVSSASVRSALIDNELPLTSNNIYSEIQASLLRPIYISSLMANDTFLKDWMIEGEEDVAKVSKYLLEIRDRYQVSSTFVVSANSGNYYHFDGILKQVSPKVPKDAWFYSMADHEGEYRVDVDYNEANRNTLTIFVNHKLFDYDGHFIGVAGLGLDVTSVASMIERYQHDYHREIYFVDHQGQVKSHWDESLIDRVNILTQPGIQTVAEELLNGENGMLIYPQGRDQILLSYRYIPELDWFLLVAQPESEALAPLRHALYFNLAVGALITLLVLIISGITVNRYQSRLEEMARTDKLTGRVNRQYFDIIYEHNLGHMDRRGGPMSLALFDIDNLKAVNDQLGHLEGDRVIRAIADLAGESVRRSDVVSRWGGDEFAILFLDCDKDTATKLLDALREKVYARFDGLLVGCNVAISAGVAGFREGDSCSGMLQRADERLYDAKHQGGNQVVSRG